MDKISRGAVFIYQPVIIIIRIITARETLKFTFLYKQNVLEELKGPCLTIRALENI